MTNNKKDRKKIWHRFLALMLALAMLISSENIGYVFAEPDTVTEESSNYEEASQSEDEVENEEESSEEELADMSEESSEEVDAESEEADAEAEEELIEEDSDAEIAPIAEESGEENASETENADTETPLVTEADDSKIEPVVESKKAGVVLSSESGDTEIDTTAEGDDTSQGDVALRLNSYGKPLRIYNYLYCTDAAGEKLSYTNRKVVGTTNSISVYIGNQDSEESDYQPLNVDIPVEIVDVNMTGDAAMHILPVGSGDNIVDMEIVEASYIESLDVAPNARLKITLDADLTIGKLTLGEGAELEISVSENKKLKVNESVDTLASVKIAGEGNVVFEKEVSVGKLAINNATVTAKSIHSVGEMDLSKAVVEFANDSEVTALGNITVSDSTVKGAAVLGYTSATGRVKMTLENASFDNVAVVGAKEDCKAFVTIEGSVSGITNTNFICDYDILYRENGADISAEIDAVESMNRPVSYRVKYVNAFGSNGSILGHFDKENAYTSEASIALPSFTRPGYEHDGWLHNDTKLNVIETISGNITVELVLLARPVKVTYDLGFEPGEGTNEDEGLQKIWMTDHNYHDQIALISPTQFGHDFAGWKILTAEGSKVVKGNYVISFEDLTEDADGILNLSLEATWNKHTYPIVIAIGSVVPAEYAEIYDYETETWMALSTYGKVNYVARDNTVEFKNEIQYGDSLQTFFDNEIGGFPLFRDARTDTSVKKKFSGWKTVAGAVVNEENAFKYGDILLGNRDDRTLNEFQELLEKTPVRLNPVWSNATFTLEIENCPTGWSVILNEGKSDEITVPVDSKGNAVLEDSVGSGVSITLKANKDTTHVITNWSLVPYAGTTRLPALHAAERTYAAGDAWIYYDTEMPFNDLKISFSPDKEVWLDIYDGNITFEQAVTHNNRTMYGFWHKKEIEELSYWFQNDETKEYFYIWKNTQPIYVTSNSKSTNNQLKLIGAQTVYMKDVDLTPTQAYKTWLEGKVCPKWGDFPTSEMPAGHLYNYGNIIIDNAQNSTYTANIYFSGNNNHVAAITHGNSQTGDSFRNKVYLYGKTSAASDSLKLGTLWGYLDFEINKLTVIDDENNAPYLINTNGEVATVSSAKVIAPYKAMKVTSCTFSYENSEAEILAQYSLIHTSLSGNSYVRIHGDIRSDYAGITMSGSSSLVVDGRVIRSWFHQDTGATINTTGYVIIKGNSINLGSTGTVTNGTLIANAVGFGRSGSITGGTVITNLIGNRLDNRGSSMEAANKNGDDYPFVTYNQSDSKSGALTLSGGNTFLFGHYKVNAGRVYDIGVKATDTDNPISKYISQITDENGDLDFDKVNSLSSIDELKVDVAATASRYSKKPETVMWGNSNYVVGVNKDRTVSIKRTAKIYAAGNMTFFNDTTISGGTILCHGDLTSKQNLVVSGGTINANTLGNSYALTTTDAAGLKQWKKTQITGGSITASVIGAPAGTHLDETTEHRSLTFIEKATAIVGTPNIYRDIYVNYIFDTSLFKNEGNPQNLRFAQVWNGSLERSMELMANNQEEVVLSAPVEKDLADGTQGSSKWLLDNIAEKEADRVHKTGKIMNGSESTDETLAYNHDYLALHAAKDNYQLFLKANDGNALNDAKVQIDGQSPSEIQFSGTANAASVKAGATVVLALDDSSMLTKTVIWYFDGNGKLHNAMPSVNQSANTISFAMPTSNTEVWITNELTLDLYQYSISLLNGGFGTEYDTSIRSDSIFSYTGDIVITQSNLKSISRSSGSNEMTVKANSGYSTTSTGNKIHVVSGFNNSAAPKVTLTKIYQLGDNYDSSFRLEDNTKAVFSLNGAVQLHLVQVLEKADFTLRGTDNTKDSVRFKIANTGTNAVGLGNKDGLVGNITLENMYICTGSSYGYLGYSMKDTYSPNSTVTYKKCVISSGNWYNTMCAASGVGKLVVDECDFNIKLADSWQGFFARGVKDVILCNNTKLSINEYGCTSSSTRPTVFYTGRDDSILEITDSVMNVQSRNSTNSKVYEEDLGSKGAFKEVKIIGANAQLSANHRLKLNKLTLDGGTVNVGNTAVGVNGEGYFFCPDITVNSGTIKADYVIISGYYNPTGRGLLNQSDFEAQMRANKEIQKNGQITIHEGAHVTATTFIGGDVNATIHVDGGTLNAGKIGTYGALMGYTRYMPKSGEDYIYFYEKIPSIGTVVRIDSGKVNVTDTLGGMYSQVIISGGEVNAADGAYIGLSDNDYQTLKDYYSSNGVDLDSLSANMAQVTIQGGKVTGDGHVNTPYSTVLVDGLETQVTVKNVSAECGTVTVKKANKGVGALHAASTNVDEVGVLIKDQFLAKEILIDENAKVCVGGMYVLVAYKDHGKFTVTEGSYICASDHGVTGGGTAEYNIAKDALWSSRKYEINYVLNQPTDVDVVINNPANPTKFTQGEEVITLLSALCKDGRYEFVGWYATEDCTGEPVKAIYTNTPGDQMLFAKWKPVDVEFQVVIPNSVFGSSDVDLQQETLKLVESGIGTYNEADKSFTFKETIKVPYLETVSGTHLNMSDFDILSYIFQELKFANTSLGELFIHGTQITETMADAYLNRDQDQVNHEAPIKLYVTGASNTRLALSMSLNQKDGKPVDAAFNTAPATEKKILTAYNYINRTLGSTEAFADGAGKLITATATGYTFDGWFTKSTPAPEDAAITETYLITPECDRAFYAKWSANCYDVQFEIPKDLGDGAQKITLSNDSTAANAADGEKGVLSAKVFYDEEIDGNLIIGDTDNCELPYAWKEGYVFKGWKVENTTIRRHNESTKGTQLSVEAEHGIAGLDLSKTIKFVAQFEKIKVTYDLNGGEWKDSQKGTTDSTLNYGDPLAGYKESPTIEEGTTYFTNGQIIAVNGKNYAVISTTSSQFASAKAYAEADYRNTLYKKGYTFLGWNTAKDGSGDYHGTIPQYEDIKVYAQWKANNYDLVLNSIDTSKGSKYSKVNVTQSRTVNNISVGSTISGQSNWPTTGDWYAYNNNLQGTLDEDQKRLLLGFTFDWLEPGATEKGKAGYDEYKAYGLNVTQLINDGYLFTNDGSSRFEIPGDTEYGNIPGTAVVYDYPDGSTINLYAVYRERSFVFIEYIKGSDGKETEIVMYAAPWNDYSDYPNNVYDKNKFDGYKLLRWGVNGKDTQATEYPKSLAEWNSNWIAGEGLLQQAKNAAVTLGKNDIMVYTVYVAQPDETGIYLSAINDPTAEQPTSRVTRSLPASLVTNAMFYQIKQATAGGTMPDFVSVSDMKANYYNRNYANKVAVELLVYEKGHTDGLHEPICKIDLSNVGKTERQKIADRALTAGDQVVLRLYHSKVIPESQVYKFDLKFTFEDYADQIWTFKNVQVNLVPTEYTVNYTAKQPNDSLIVPEDWTEKGFSGETDKTYTAKVNYGGELLILDAVPELVGYSPDGNWLYQNPANSNEESKSYGNTNNVPRLDFGVSDANNGTVNLTTQYTVNPYELSADLDSMKDKWSITYAGNTLTKKETIPYHTLVTFITNKENDYPEFITLEIGGQITTLDQVNPTRTEDGDKVSYSFYMPANNVHAYYDDVMELYLEVSSIELYPEKFVYNNREVTWHGDYIILMDENNNVGAGAAVQTTANVLTLHGDLSDRDIQLGNLNITSANSIQLTAEAKAVLGLDYTTDGSTIVAKNIHVPYGASLSIKDEGRNGSLTLSPDALHAAIGGTSNGENGGNGTIYLQNLDIHMNMPVGSTASGIGTGSNGQCGDIELANCSVTVAEAVAQTGQQPYQGAWIGGAAVENVVLSNTQLNGVAGAVIVNGPKALYANNVTLNSCTVGSEDVPVTNPIVAKASLKLLGNESARTQIYQSTASGIQPIQAVVAYDEDRKPKVLGTIEAKYTDLLAAVETANQNELYYGLLKIGDVTTDIRIANTLILDTNNGDITIGNKVITQGAKTHNHENSCLIIDEFENSIANDLTISKDASAPSITVKDADIGTVNASAAFNTQGNVSAQTFNANESIALNVEGSITVSNPVIITSEKLLTVNVGSKANDHAGAINFVNGFDATTTGNYQQVGGTLTGAGDLVVGGNMQLGAVNAAGVEATVTEDHKIGSIGKTGVTTVTLIDSKVTAGTIGAIGEHNATFTEVVLGGTNVLNGTVVQDHYRLAYDLTDPNFAYDKNGVPLDSSTENPLDTVFRTSETYDAGELTDGGCTSYPVIPGKPKFNGTTTYFSNWYFVAENNRKIALDDDGAVDGFEATDIWKSLTTAALAYAGTTEPVDGTKTLTLHAWMSIQGTGTITEGRKFESFDTTAMTVEVPKDSAWTAQYTVKGSVPANGKLRFTFAEEIPAGTKFTLAHIPGYTAEVSEPIVPTYYYYVVPEKTSVLNFSNFTIFGGNTVLADGGSGNYIEDMYLLAADFSEASAPATNDIAVKFEVAVGSDLQAATIIDVASVSYKLNELPGEEYEVDADSAAGTVSVSSLDNPAFEDLSLYLTVKLSAPIGYDVAATLKDGSGNEITGTVLGNQMITFNLGNYSAKTDAGYTYQIEGLPAGEYTPIWYLTAAADGNKNIFYKELAEDTNAGKITVADTAKSMKVVLVRPVSDRVFTVGKQQELTFEIPSEGLSSVSYNDIVVTAEKQGTFANFNLHATLSEEASATYTVTIPTDWTAGTYRICFSCTNDEVKDNKYFSFILENAN